ncbi:sigma-70 family RNA polymerase sigma factor [bacterium]|nr:sigma-70 family RNA polymerase sigma factor [bacterium]
MRAFETLLKKYERILFGYIINQVGSSEKAKDIYQDVYLKIIENIDKFKKESSYKSWLFLIARNTIIDFYRKKNIAAISLDKTTEDIDKPLHEIIPTEENTPSTSLSIKSENSSLSGMLERLEPSLREICFLRFHSELKFSEIADMIGSNENSVKTKLRKALSLLKEEYEML